MYTIFTLCGAYVGNYNLNFNMAEEIVQDGKCAKISFDSTRNTLDLIA